MKTDNFGIKLILTIPAICIGLLRLISFIFQPVTELWVGKPEPPPQPPKVLELPHDFH